MPDRHARRRAGIRGAAPLAAAFAAVLALLAGCGPETVEQSQSRRMHDLSTQSYSKEELQGHSSEPDITPYNSGMEGTPVVPGEGHQDSLPIDP